MSSHQYHFQSGLHLYSLWSKMMVLYECGVIINKLTANKVSKTDIYPSPKIEEFYFPLRRSNFSKLDISHAYLQVPLAEESHKYLVINTHKGLYTYKRLFCSCHFSVYYRQYITGSIRSVHIPR